VVGDIDPELRPVGASAAAGATAEHCTATAIEEPEDAAAAEGKPALGPAARRNPAEGAAGKIAAAADARPP
jgi:hypothetical protein